MKWIVLTNYNRCDGAHTVVECDYDPGQMRAERNRVTKWIAVGSLEEWVLGYGLSGWRIKAGGEYNQKTWKNLGPSESIGS